MQKSKFDEEYEILRIKSTRQSRSDVPLETSTAYYGALPIIKSKKDEFMAPWQDGTIPKEYHSFYTSLPCVECCDHLAEADYEEKTDEEPT